MNKTIHIYLHMLFTEYTIVFIGLLFIYIKLTLGDYNHAHAYNADCTVWRFTTSVWKNYLPALLQTSATAAELHALNITCFLLFLKKKPFSEKYRACTASSVAHYQQTDT